MDRPTDNDVREAIEWFSARVCKDEENNHCSPDCSFGAMAKCCAYKTAISALRERIEQRNEQKDVSAHKSILPLKVSTQGYYAGMGEYENRYHICGNDGTHICYTDFLDTDVIKRINEESKQ